MKRVVWRAGEARTSGKRQQQVVKNVCIRGEGGEGRPAYRRLNRVDRAATGGNRREAIMG